MPGKTPCQYCKPAREMLQEMAGLQRSISLRIHYFEDNPPEKGDLRRRARAGDRDARHVPDAIVKFYGIPGGTEFPMFIESIIDLSRGEVLLSEESLKALEELHGDVSLRVFVTPTCPYCPAMMRAAYQMAMVSPECPRRDDRGERVPGTGRPLQVQAVPLTVIADRVSIPGMVPEAALVEQVVKAAESVLATPEQVEGPATPAAPPAPIERGKERPSGLIIP